MKLLITGLSLIIFVQITASASTRCEYGNWVGNCDAAIKRNGNWIRITSDTQQCSRVDWYVNGQENVTIVTDGTESELLLNFPDDAIVIKFSSWGSSIMSPLTINH